MGLIDIIKKVLREQTDGSNKKIEPPLILRRRLEMDWLDEQFNNSLQIAADKYREKKDKLLDMSAKKFINLVTVDVMVELCTKYNVCGNSFGKYDEIWDFIGEYYYSKIIKTYYDIQYED